MGASSGPLRKIVWGRKSIVLTADNETNFWIGGEVNTEVNNDIGGQSPKTEHVGGFLTGVTSRCVDTGSIKNLHDLIQATTVGDVDITLVFSNKDAFTAPCFAVVDPTAFYNNADGKSTFDLYPRKSVWSPL